MPKSADLAPDLGTLTAMPDTSYASCGDLSIAYQVFGDGPVDLVYAGSFVSHIELFWTMPEYEAFMQRLSTFCRVLVFDKAGVGLSDPVPQVRTLDTQCLGVNAQRLGAADGLRRAVEAGEVAIAGALDHRAAESFREFGGDLTEAMQYRPPPLIAGRRGALRRRDHVGEQHGAEGAMGLRRRGHGCR